MTVKRPYDGSRRAATTRATKRAVVSAAQDLFVRLGYPATTVARISEESGVPPATIYRLFGSKHEILRAVVDVAFGGDDEPIEFRRRPEVQAALSAEDPARMLAAFATMTQQVMHRAAGLQHVLSTSAAVDPDAAEMLETMQQQRLVGQSRVADELARRGVLRPELTRQTAADVIYALMSPELYRILTIDRGWQPDAYVAWLAGSLRAQLLGGSEGGGHEDPSADAGRSGPSRRRPHP